MRSGGRTGLKVVLVSGPIVFPPPGAIDSSEAFSVVSAILGELLIVIGVDGLAIVRPAWTAPGTVSEIATTGVFNNASSSGLNLVIGSASKWIFCAGPPD